MLSNHDVGMLLHELRGKIKSNRFTVQETLDFLYGESRQWSVTEEGKMPERWKHLGQPEVEVPTVSKLDDIGVPGLSCGKPGCSPFSDCC